MYSIFRIEEYLPETESIRVRFCEEQSHYPIDQGRAVMVNCKDLDCYSADTFAFSLMKSYGEVRLRKQKNKQPVLPENMGGEIEGKLDIQGLVGKVIKVKDQPRVMHILKTREVTL
tara:strand:+ start:139 stop:486 length:348 start_codon:yes stop_codon:yes gene_type:complete